jgi:hypothetical protein
MKLYMFQTVCLSIIRSFSLYRHQWYMSYRFANSLRAVSGFNCSSILILLISCHQTCMTCVYSVYSEKLLMIDRETVKKNVEFKSKNKFEKLMHLVGFIIRNFSWCTVTWMSNKMYTFWVEHNSVFYSVSGNKDRLCGLVVRVSGYRYRGPGQAAGPTSNTARLSQRYKGKTRGCHCSHWAPDDGWENARNMLSCKQTPG